MPSNKEILDKFEQEGFMGLLGLLEGSEDSRKLWETAIAVGCSAQTEGRIVRDGGKLKSDLVIEDSYFSKWANGLSQEESQELQDLVIAELGMMSAEDDLFNETKYDLFRKTAKLYRENVESVLVILLLRKEGEDIAEILEGVDEER